MQKVVHQNMEPITPFSLRVRQLYEMAHISTILAARNFCMSESMETQFESIRLSLTKPTILCDLHTAFF